MSDSATIEKVGLRERKRAATRAAITRVARSMTIRHGVNGFTVEQVCEEAGISRRTFFNYFPAKEDAILGHPADDIPEDLAAVFVTSGPAQEAADGTLSPHLIDDFAALSIGMVERMALKKSEVVQLKKAVMAEPNLLQRATHGSHHVREAFLELLAAREKLPVDDSRLRMAIAVLEAVNRRAGEDFFNGEDKRSYREIMAAAVADLRTILAPILTPDSHPRA